jgi:hypothetical protein
MPMDADPATQYGRAMRGSRIQIAVVGGLLAAALLLTPAAQASFVDSTGSRVSAAPGEQNSITIVRSGSTATYTDTAGISALGAPNCVQNSTIQVTCTNVTSSLIISTGDGDDRIDVTTTGVTSVGVSGGDGNDVIDASKVVGALLGAFAGDGGNDAVTGSPGPDSLDIAVALATTPGPATSAGDDRLSAGGGADFVNAEGGADTVDAGDGDDIVSTIGPNASGVLDEDFAPDSIVCGGGTDRATLGQGDQVGADCETVGHHFACPAGGPACVCDGTITAAGRVGAGGSLASASKKKKRKRGPIVLGKSKTRLQPGETRGVTIELRPGSVNTALRGRNEIGAVMNLRTGKKKGKGKKGKAAAGPVTSKTVRFRLKR